MPVSQFIHQSTDYNMTKNEASELRINHSHLPKLSARSPQVSERARRIDLLQASRDQTDQRDGRSETRIVATLTTMQRASFQGRRIAGDEPESLRGDEEELHCQLQGFSESEYHLHVPLAVSSTDMYVCVCVCNENDVCVLSSSSSCSSSWFSWSLFWGSVSGLFM